MKKRVKWVLVLSLISTFLFGINSTAAAEGGYKFVTKWGSQGSGDGQFVGPCGITVDSSDNVYVADTYNNRIQKFDSNGGFLMQWGLEGSGDGQFYRPWSIAVDNDGNVYVADTHNHRIQKFDSNGTFLTKWGLFGHGDGKFFAPRGIAVDSSGNVYVADTNNERIQKFDSNGTFLTKWGSSGSGDGKFFAPRGIAVDSSGNVYVVDYNHRIQKFDSNGTFLTKWGSSGSGDGQFVGPCGITVDSSGNVYVVDHNHRIQKFDSNGTFLTKWGSYGSGDGQFNSPQGIAVDSSGNVYVADTPNHRIQKFSSASQPDLSPTSLVFSKDSVAVHEQISIDCCVENIGDAEEQNVIVRLFDNDAAIDERSIERIEASGRLTVSFSRSFDEIGYRKISVVVDPENLISEKDETNNSIERILKVGSDFTVSTISFEPQEPIVDSNVNLLGKIESHCLTTTSVKVSFRGGAPSSAASKLIPIGTVALSKIKHPYDNTGENIEKINAYDKDYYQVGAGKRLFLLQHDLVDGSKLTAAYGIFSWTALKTCTLEAKYHTDSNYTAAGYVGIRQPEAWMSYINVFQPRNTQKDIVEKFNIKDNISTVARIMDCGVDFKNLCTASFGGKVYFDYMLIRATTDTTSFTVPILPGRQTTEVTLPWSAEFGSHDIYMNIEPTDLSDTDLSNNTTSKNIVVSDGWTDLSITPMNEGSISVTPIGSNILAKAAIENEGNVATTVPVLMRYRKLGELSWSTLLDNRVTVHAHSSTPVAALMQALPEGYYEVSVDLTTDPLTEINTSNDSNTFFIVSGIKQAVTLSPASSVLLMYPGTFLETVSITKGITIYGSGKTTTTIDGCGAPVTMNIASKDIVILKNFGVTGGRTGINASYCGKLLCDGIGAKNCETGLFAQNSWVDVMRGSEFINNSSYGLYAYYSYFSEIQCNNFSYNAIGVKNTNTRVTYSGYNVFSNNTVAYVHDPSIPLGDFPYENNAFSGNLISILYVGEGASSLNIYGNSINGSKIGIWGISGTPVITDNVISNCDVGLFSEVRNSNISTNSFSANILDQPDEMPEAVATLAKQIWISEQASDIGIMLMIVDNLQFDNGLRKSLTTKLASASGFIVDGLKYLNADKDKNAANSFGAAANKLTAFTNEVNAQSGKGIDKTSADQLIEHVDAIVQALKSGSGLINSLKMRVES